MRVENNIQTWCTKCALYNHSLYVYMRYLGTPLALCTCNAERSGSQCLVDFIRICEEREAERYEDVAQRQVQLMLTFQLCADGVIGGI